MSPCESQLHRSTPWCVTVSRRYGRDGVPFPIRPRLTSTIVSTCHHPQPTIRPIVDELSREIGENPHGLRSRFLRKIRLPNALECPTSTEPAKRLCPVSGTVGGPVSGSSAGRRGRLGRGRGALRQVVAPPMHLPVRVNSAPTSPSPRVDRPVAKAQVEGRVHEKPEVGAVWQRTRNLGPDLAMLIRREHGEADADSGRRSPGRHGSLWRP